MTSFPLITLQNAHGLVTLTPYGGCVLSYLPAGGTDVLWQTTPELLEKAYQNNKALRGGVPLCWPWFRSHATLPQAPSHGFARLMLWHVAAQTESSATLTLTTDGSRADFPYASTATLQVMLGEALTLTLTTTNHSTQPLPLSPALHTYLAVADIGAITVHGLADTPRHHIGSGTELPPHEGPLGITEETEILYRGVQGTIEVHDPVYQRRLTVTSSASADAAIWNPWVEKAKTLDMPPTDYTRMLCVEAVQAIPQLLQPGQSHTLFTTLKALNGLN